MRTFDATQTAIISSSNVSARWAFIITDGSGNKYGSGLLSPDLLDENCADISDWTDGDKGTGVSEVDPAGQFRFDTNLSAANDDYAYRYRTIASPPNKFTVEIKTYFDSLGTFADTDRMAFWYSTGTWRFLVEFASDGLWISKASGAVTEVGTNIVKCNGTAALQTWRFQLKVQ